MLMLNGLLQREWTSPFAWLEVPHTAPPLIKPVVMARDPTPAELAACVLASPVALGYVLDSLTKQELPEKRLSIKRS